jgi:hypothetical protein
LRSGLLRAGVALSAVLLHTVAIGDTPPRPPAASEKGETQAAPASARRRSRHPIEDSIDRAVDKVLKAHQRPCEVADREGVPCFPVTLAVEGPKYSVADALRHYRVSGREPASAPTNDEMQEQLSGRPATSPPVTFVSIDPVCTTKSLIRSLSGKPNTFYLYRFTDRQGERPLLTDRKLNPESYASRPDIHYEYLGRFSGECEAIAAWRRALRHVEPAPADDPRPSTPREEEAPPP